jgi:peptidoglycan/LPS O-acetylase OafA/YrhL
MLRRRRAAVALVTWTFLVWTTRIANIWRDAALDTSGKVGRTLLATSFTLLAAAVGVALWRRSRRRVTAAVDALAAWTAAVWIVRGVAITAGDHPSGFKAVHGVLAVVSLGLAAWAWRENRRLARPHRLKPPVTVTPPASAPHRAPASGSGSRRRP